MNHYGRFSHLQRQTKEFRPRKSIGYSVHEIRKVHRFLPHDEIAESKHLSDYLRFEVKG